LATTEEGRLELAKTEEGRMELLKTPEGIAALAKDKKALKALLSNKEELADLASNTLALQELLLNPDGQKAIAELVSDPDALAELAELASISDDGELAKAFLALFQNSDQDENDEDDGSVPKSIRIFPIFDQKINEGVQCQKVEVKDRNIVLCRNAGFTNQFMIAKNVMNGMNSLNGMNAANCPTQTENIPLTGALEPQGIRLLANLDPCMINDGSITLNYPYTQDIKVAVMHLDITGNNHKSALIDPGQIQTLTNNQGLFKLDLDQIMVGIDPKTGQITTVTDINGLALYNNGVNPIPFGPSNSAALTAISAAGQTFGGLALPQGNIIGNLPGPNMLQGNIPGNQLMKPGPNFLNPSSPITTENQLIKSDSLLQNQFSTPPPTS
ncbi:MAG TPA: hypothetical protein VFY68_17515, partial [Nitrososphaeraceae archaeon]|nr:hypothetical protein [Nitrososphaeraceae archaeon]